MGASVISVDVAIAAPGNSTSGSGVTAAKASCATVIRVVSPDHLHVDVLERQVTDFIARLRRAD